VVRMSAQLNRLRVFKKVASQSTWYYNLLQRLCESKIDKKPLTRYMAGKYSPPFWRTPSPLQSIMINTFVFVPDQIKNVIESGQVYDMNHFNTLLQSLDPRDLYFKREVQL